MLQKTTIFRIIRRSILVICAVFCLSAFCACSDEQSSNMELSGIYATDISVAYDGRAHTVFVKNTLDTDTILYSADNVTFAYSAPAFTDVGVYTVYYKVVREGYAAFCSSAKITISPIVLSGIYADDISVVYDGQPHSITIEGTLNTDTITYSTDGVNFSQTAPTLTEVGDYTVYYRVIRPYGDYRSSCSVTISQNIYGRYFNPLYGVVTVDEHSTEIENISNGVLTYNDAKFSRISDSDFVYKLTAAENTVYFCAEQSGTLSIVFSDNSAVIKYADRAIVSVPDFNYCESGAIADYANLCFEQQFLSSADITDVTVALSVRDVNPVMLDRLYFTYDGHPHAFDFTETVVFLGADQPPEFTDVGKYTATAVVLSDTYLPCVVDCYMVILPDISGTYFSSVHALHISGGKVYFDGVAGGELTVRDDDWAYNGLPISATDDGLIYDGDAYTQTTDRVIVIRVDGSTYSTLTLRENIDMLVVEHDGLSLDFSLDGKIILSIPLDCDGITVLLDGEPLSDISSDSYYVFVIGHSDLSLPVVLIEIITE